MEAGVSRSLTALATAALIGMSGACGGEFVNNSDGPDAGTDPAALARQMFDEEVLPMLETSCSACHVGADTKGFMRPNPDVWTSLMGHPNLIVGGNPNDSRLYAYGRSPNHSGPEFTPEQAELVRQWIEIVPFSGMEPPKVETGKFAPQVGANTVELGALAQGITGAKLTFTATPLATGLYITELKAQAGDGGLHIAHPLFVTYCPGPKPDPVDSFYGLDQIVNPAETSTIGGGTVVLVDYTAGCELAVLFKVIEPGMAGPMNGDDGGVTGSGGCVNVAGFTANARGPLAAQCGSCHAGGQATAKNAYDLSAINDMSADGQTRACAQTRNKINLNNEPQSILFQRVAPGQQTGHPLTLNDAQYTAFRDPVVTWAVTE
jgi:hypothetical protein